MAKAEGTANLSGGCEIRDDADPRRWADRSQCYAFVEEVLEEGPQSGDYPIAGTDFEPGELGWLN